MVRPLIARNGEIMSVTTTASMAALTFDDGPHPYWTPRYLRLLAAFNMRATFFVLGEKAERHPELIGAIADAGHAIGLHGWDHAALAEADGDGDLVKFNALLDRSLEALGSVHCKLFRPPFGQASRDIRRAVRGHGLEMVGWSVSAWDWQDRSAVDMADKVTARLRRGSIVLLHDDLADPAEPRFVDRAQSLDALGLILARRDDLQFVTVPELLGAGTPHRARPKRNVAGR